MPGPVSVNWNTTPSPGTRGLDATKSSRKSSVIVNGRTEMVISPDPSIASLAFLTRFRNTFQI